MDYSVYNFVKATKNEIRPTSAAFEEFLIACNNLVATSRIGNEVIKNFSSEVSGYLAWVSNISKVLSRDQMKVAFIGRTSYGKSTTINAMLQDEILPMGIGPTTNCFISVNVSDSTNPHILVPGGDDKKNMEGQPLIQLSQILSKEKLDPGSLVQVFLPKSRCKMLSEGVVFVDSPGIDLSPELDLWIDQHCLDADVFVLVVDAVSGLQFTVKNFLRKVNKLLLGSDIFILYNRCDTSASEPDEMNLVKEERLRESTSFLVDELKYVLDKGQAEDRVFFVSAQATLMNRMQKHQGMSQEGFLARQREFENFEGKFQECFSKSAMKTKFESYVVNGWKIAKIVRAHMEQMEGSASQQRLKLEGAKKKQENELKHVNEQLEIYQHDINSYIEEITSKVKDQVTKAMNEEICQLGLLVNEFVYPFHPHHDYLETYKKELCNHIKSGLGRIMTACSNSQTVVILKAQREMGDRLNSLLSLRIPEVSLELVLPVLHFRAKFELIVTRLCNNFLEDMRPQRAGLVIAWKAKIQQSVQSWISTAPAVVQWLALIATSTSTLVVIVGVLIWKSVGWWPMALCGGLYGVVHEIKSRDSNGAKEKAFKRRFVDYASKKLQSEVSVISSECRVQVRQELTSTLAKLESVVQKEVQNMERKMFNELYEEIMRLGRIENDARILGVKASKFERQFKLFKFITEFGLEESRIGNPMN